MHTVLFIVVLVNITFIVARYTLDSSLNESGKMSLFVAHLIFNIFILAYLFFLFVNQLQQPQLYEPIQPQQAQIQQQPQQSLPLDQIVNLVGQVADNKSKKGADIINLITTLAQNNPELVTQVISAISGA